MKKRFAKSLFIFRRDLRLYDNCGLNAALQQSEQVLACFIFDPRQIEPHPYQSQPGLQFMLEALQDLQQQFNAQQCQLGLYHGQPEQIVSRLQREQAFEAIFVNRDYSLFSRQRDAELQTFCQTQGLVFYSCADALLNEPEHNLKSDGSAYQVFTAFYNRARLHPVAPPQGLADGQWLDGEQHTDLISRLRQVHRNALAGGRQAALQRITGCA